MQTFRQILDVKNHSVKIQLPSDLNADQVEVIIIPIEKKKEIKGIAKLRGKLNLSDNQYIEFQDNVKISREGWKKRI